MPQQDPSKFDVLGGLSSSADLMSRGAGIAGDYVATADVLITVPDQVRGIGKAFGVGRRIVVPAEEIHIVTGGGMHSFFGISKETHVYGQAAKKLPLYWLNPLTSVVKLKTVSFIVRVVGDNSQGVNALDMDKVPFLVWAHVVAKLNPDVAMTAAQRIGNDIRGLVTTITEVTQSEIIAAASRMGLETIIADRQQLAKRLQAEEEARANRDRDVLLIGAKADAEAIRIGAEAAAEKKRTEAQATAAAADFEATAKERDSAAQIKQATATRAKTAAEGLAQAEVAEAKAAAEIKQAEAAQATGFAQAAIAEKDAAVEAGRIRLVAEAELDAEARRAKLYAESPELLALERLDREHWQAIALAKQELDARVAMMVALAPHIQLDAKVIGNGSQMGQIMGQMMTLASGYNVMVNDPTVSSIVGSGGSAISVGGDILSRVLPAVRSAFAGVNPRVFASLTVADALDRLQGVVSGEQDVVTAIQKLRDDANFRMVGNIPVGQILGVFLGGGGEATQPAGDESLVLQ